VAWDGLTIQDDLEFSDIRMTLQVTHSKLSKGSFEVRGELRWPDFVKTSTVMNGTVASQVKDNKRAVFIQETPPDESSGAVGAGEREFIPATCHGTETISLRLS